MAVGPKVRVGPDIAGLRNGVLLASELDLAQQEQAFFCLLLWLCSQK